MTRTLLAAAMMVALPALAEDVTIKLGTLAPQGSSWHVLLKEMAERFSQVSDGKVKLKIYAGGTQGGEGDMVRKMGVGQLQASSITSVGLHDIAPESMVFTTPGLMDAALVNEVFPSVQKRLEASLEAKGYVVLHWAQVGTIYIFCTKPYKTPEQASEAKFFAWDGDPGAIDAFKLIGFRPVVLGSVDVVPSLQTGMITCISQAPAYVLTARLFDKANKMVDFPWSYLIGATVVRKDTWDKVPADLKPKLLQVAREGGAKVDAEVKKLNDDAIAAMQKQGLELVKVDPGPWQKAADRSWPAVRGKVVPADFFDEVVRLRDAAKKKLSAH
jgi:TRAP-type C4-dicarboxylate transport system substrate-binding protein